MVTVNPKQRWANESLSVFLMTSLLLILSNFFLHYYLQFKSEPPTGCQVFFHIICKTHKTMCPWRSCFVSVALHPIPLLSLGVYFPGCSYLSYDIFFHRSFGADARFCPLCLNPSSNSESSFGWHALPATGENNLAWPRPTQTSLWGYCQCHQTNPP